MNALQTATAGIIRPERPVKRAVTNPASLTARLAIDRKTRNDAFALRHTAYLSGGYIDPRPMGLFSDPFDDMPNTRTVVMYKDQRPVASLRICMLDTDPTLTGWDDIPAHHVFPKEIDDLLAAVPQDGEHRKRKSARAIEINRLVRHPDFVNDFELVFVMFRFSTFMTLYFDTDIMLSAVRRNHVPFYKRMQFSMVAGPRAYPELKFETNLMICHRENYGNVMRKVPIIDSNAMETGCYDGLFRGETVPVFGGK